MIFRNNNKIANIYRGTLKISNVYRGGILVHTGEKPIPITYDGLTFEALEPSTIQYVPSTVATAQYSYDAVNWNSADNVTLNLNTGDKVFFKGTITGNQTASNRSQFSMTGKISASGSIMSLQAGNPQDNSLNYDYEFCRLFSNCTNLVTAPALPATTLINNCYSNMFNGCTSLTTAPDLPATTLADSCYSYMFYNCNSLTTAPELPATTLAVSCYSYMFGSCTSLTAAPKLLPATTLAESCYKNMFYNCTNLITPPELPATRLSNSCYSTMFRSCTSLVTAPELPATTLVTNCYKNMFTGCKKLNYIKALFTTTPSTTYTSSWVNGVATDGTFVKNKDATWDVTGANGIPTGWTIQTA